MSDRVMAACPICNWRAHTFEVSEKHPRPTGAGRGPISDHMRMAHGWDRDDIMEFCLQLMMGDPIVTEAEQSRIRQALNTTIPRVPPLRLVDKEPPS